MKSVAPARPTSAHSRENGIRPRLNERGNVFFTLFGAVAVVGVLGAGIMSTMRGPLSTMVEVNRIEETKAEMGISLRLLLLKASEQDAATPDVLTEPLAPVACTSAANAGCIPVGPAKQKDAWGTPYAYCAWNNGSNYAAIGSTILAGDVSTNNVAVALISAGPDRTFQVGCQTNARLAGNFQVLTPADGVLGDDIVRKYNYNDAVAGSDGLWELDTTGPTGDFAKVQEEISVGGGAGSVSTFEGSGAFDENVRTEGELQTDVISPHPANSLDYIEFMGSLLLPEKTGLSCADPDNKGAIAYDGTANSVAYCDGSTWVPVGKSLWIEDTNGMRNDDTLAANVGIGEASSATLRLAVTGATKLTGVLGATGAVDFDTTLNVDGATDLKSTLDVVGATTLDSTLGVVGATELDATLGVDGTTEMRDDLTVISNVFINETAAGVDGNITVQNDITATAGDVIVTAGNVDVTAGNITAAAGNIVATAGDITATAGDIAATAGSVTAGTTLVAGTTVTAGTGITATTGNITATAGTVEAEDFIYNGNDFTPGNCNVGSFHRWSGTAWVCETTAPMGTGTGGALTLKDVLANGDDADGDDAQDFGKIGADEYCDAGLATCVTSANLVAGSQIWKKDGPGSATGEIYYNSGNVGIGTNDPTHILDILHTSNTGTPADNAVINVKSQNRNSVILLDSTASHFGALLFTAVGQERGRIQYSNTSNFMSFHTNANGVASAGEQARITSSGLFGIGTIDPKTKLDIAGTLKIGDGTELCNSVDHEGAIRYVAATDAFQMCRNSTTGWEALGSGSGTGLPTCTVAGQVAQWDGDSWECVAMGSGGGSSTIDISWRYWTYNSTDSSHNWDGPGANFRNCEIVEYFQTTDYVQNTKVLDILVSTMGTDRTLWDNHAQHAKFTRDFTPDPSEPVNSVNYGAWSKPKYAASILYRCQVDDGTGMETVNVPGGGTDTLAGLSCTSGQVAAWNGTAWACSTPASGGGGGTDVSFSVHKNNVDQSIPANTPTKLTWSHEIFDTNNNFNTTTSRFTPSVAGKYFVTASVLCPGATNACQPHIYKNGSVIARGKGSGTVNLTGVVSMVVDMNGTTDYLEVYGANEAGTSGIYGFPGDTFFTGFLIGGGGSGGSGLWTDSGNGYIEYSVADAGAKLANITGMSQPALGLATGMTWDEGTSSLNITGNITYTGTITDTSDRRLKTDIENLVKYGSMLDKIKAVDTYSFRMCDKTSMGDTMNHCVPVGEREFGVMAQELEGVFPELVKTADDEMRTKSVNYVGLIAPMIEGVKELAAENAALKAEVEALRSEKETVKADVTALKDQVALLNKLAADDAEKASSFGLWLAMLGALSLSGAFGFVVLRQRKA